MQQVKYPPGRKKQIYASRRWRNLRIRIFERDGWRCVFCEKPSVLECDHIIPLQCGGKVFDPENLRSLCRSCHIETHRRTPKKRTQPKRDQLRGMIKLGNL